MSDGEEETRHRGLFHRHKEDGEEKEPRTAEEELKHHKNLGHLGKATALAAGAYALHEKHKAKKDPENASRHKTAQEIAATVALGAGGFAYHEHHKKKEAKERLKDEEGQSDD